MTATTESLTCLPCFDAFFGRLDYCNTLLIGLLLPTDGYYSSFGMGAERHCTSSSIWYCRGVTGVTMYAQPWWSYTGCPSCTESSSSWHWWCSRSTHTAAKTTSPILWKHTTVIRHELVSSRHLALTILFYGLEQNLMTELSLSLAYWMEQSTSSSSWSRQLHQMWPWIITSLMSARPVFISSSNCDMSSDHWIQS